MGSKPPRPRPSTTVVTVSQPFTSETVNDITVAGVNERQSAAINYANLAVIGLRIQASDQLSGGIPQIITPILGRIVETDTTPSASRNPAWIVQDFLKNTRYGLGSRLPSLAIDQDSIDDFAAECAENIPQFDGSSTNEPRYLFDGIIDSRQSAVDHILAILATARASFLKYGDLVKIIQEKPKAPVQMFTQGNIESDSLEISYVSRREKSNIVEIGFLNRDNDFQQDVEAAEPDLPPEEEKRQSLTLFGITRATQAKRAAAYLLRSNQLPIRVISFRAAADAIAIEPGDVFRFAHDLPDWQFSGRIKGLSAGNVQIDRTIAFSSGIVYEYLERDDDGTVNSVDFVLSTTTDVLPFAPLGAGTATGRIWRIGAKYRTTPDFMALEVSAPDARFTRRIQAIEYVEAVFSDSSNPSGVGLEVRTTGSAPPNVTGLSAVESLATDGRSTVAVSWTASAGAAYYQVWYQFAAIDSGFGDFESVGTTDGTALNFSTTLAFGRVLRIRVQAIGPLGERADVDASAEVEILLLRDDSESPSVIAEIPGNVTGLAIGSISGTSATISWTAVPDADEYRVTIGNWTSSLTIYEGTGTSTPVVTSKLPTDFCVRARIGNVWSLANARVTSAVATLAGYTTLVGTQTNGSFETGTLQNGVAIASPTFGFVALQLVNSLPVAWVSPSIDAGSNLTCHVSINVMGAAHIETPASQFLASQRDICAYGPIGPQLVDVNVVLQTSQDGAAWEDEDVTLLLGKEDIVRTSRYFRLVATVDDQDSVQGISALAMLQKAEISVYKP